MRSYLRDIGRVPLLTHEQEITLGRQVQQLMEIETLEAELKEQRGGEEVAREELAKAAGCPQCSSSASCRQGHRAKERMVAANLRLGGERCQEIHQAEYGTSGFNPGGNDWFGPRRRKI